MIKKEYFQKVQFSLENPTFCIYKFKAHEITIALIKMTKGKKEGNFELEKLVSIPNFHLPQLNYGKDKLSFFWDKTGRIELFIMDLMTRKITQISQGEVPRDLKTDYIRDCLRKH